MISYIEVPDMNDSKSRVTLAGQEFFIRFTYSGRNDSWYFSLYDSLGELLLGMIKILPLCPLTEYYTSVRLPDGRFGCFTDMSHVGRNTFLNGEAKFGFIPNEDLEGWEPYE